MENLLSILFPKGRAEVLRVLFPDESREVHLREITRQSGLGLGTMQDELKKLLDADLVVTRRDGNRRYFRANDHHPLFHDLQQLVLKTSGLRDVLAQALDGLKGVAVAFVFGSLAAGPGKGASDVDLMVIGAVGLRALTPKLRIASEKLGREINPVTMTASEFGRGRKKHPLWLDIQDKEKIFIVGDAAALERLV